MREFTLVERTESYTLKEVVDFIDDTNISKMDACELKSRIVDVIQVEREKAIDESIEEMKKFIAFRYGLTDMSLKLIDKVAEQLKGGSDKPQ